MKLQILLTAILLMFSVNTFACGVNSGDTNLSASEVVRLIRERGVSVCIDDTRFDNYDIKRFLQAGATVQITSQGGRYFDSYDIKSFLNYGKLILEYNTKVTTKFDTYDLNSMLREGLILHVRDLENHFDLYDMKKLLDNGAVVILRTDVTRFDSYDIKSLASHLRNNRNARILVRVWDDKFSRRELQDFFELGIEITYN